MTDTTPRLALPEIQASQAQKHVTHNEALVQLDAFFDLYLKGQFINTPPGSPSDGDTYLLGGTPTGAWSGYAYKIAYLVDGSWRFYTPFNGLRAYVSTSGQFIIYESGSWNAWTPSSIDTFAKADYDSAAFTKTGAGTVSIKAGAKVALLGVTYTFASDTAVQMPTLTSGTNYAIYMCNDGTVRADANFSAPSGFTTSTSRKIGGFHYAPGGNATGTSGGDTTPAINAYSLWDLKWRPSCPDPRGMALIGNRFWCDIYLCNTAPETNGTSGYNLTIADGSNPPKIPTIFGGNGSTAYSEFNWWEAAEVMSAAGKSLLSYQDFAAAMYGSTEAASFGSDPGTTTLRAAYTSKWGIMLATGNMWIWGSDFSYWPGSGTADYKAQTGGRGSLYLANDTGVVAALFGGPWYTGANAGSRASLWNVYPWYSLSDVGARGRCDHLRLA